MDDVDHIQEMESLAQDALLAERRRLAALDALAIPPAARECRVCGEDISQARLKLLPRTTMCVDCAAEAERPRR
jgi:phage/conjugal plasmid C-4 type zinc finger TraR family protein